jgi:peptidoglycan/xylan/chitin deacetylase (PgdA/CDA1 family)
VNPAAWFRKRQPVTLVLDDAPSDATPDLLNRLESGGHRGVLFVIGANIAGREAILVEAVRRGFALGNHSFSHPQFSEIGVEAARGEIQRTEALIETLYARARLPRPGRWFRFPYLDTGGDDFEAIQTLLRDLGFRRPPALDARLAPEALARIDWPSTLLTRDWALPGEAAVRQTLRQARAGDVIEFHDKVETVGAYAAGLVEELDRLALRAAIPGRRFGGGR